MHAGDLPVTCYIAYTSAGKAVGKGNNPGQVWHNCPYGGVVITWRNGFPESAAVKE